jgi:hypothetical protein
MEIGTPRLKPEPGGRLRVAWTVADGYWWAAWYVRDYAAMAALWAIVAAAAQLLLGGMFGGASGEASPVAAAHVPTLATFAATLLGAAAIAVAAYRLAMLGEQPSWRQRIGRRELRVFGLSLLVYVAAVAEMLALVLVFQAGEGLDAPVGSSAESDQVLRLIVAAVLWSLLIAFTITPFIGLAFPLAALDAPSGLFRRSFEMSRGHRLRLAAIAFLADLPWLVASYLPWLAWQSFSGEIPESLQVGVSTFITLLGTAFGSMVLGKAFAAIADRQREGIYDVFD